MGEPNDEINIDELSVNLLIIAKNCKKLQASAQFLSRRDWPTHVVSDIAKAVEFISQNRPDFVLLSINHPHPSVAKLPQLISQAFDTTCVAFAENMDAATATRLSRSDFKYKITGAASGPNIHRSIRRFLEEKLNEAKASDLSIPPDNQLVTIKGEDGTRDPQGGYIQIKSDGDNGANVNSFTNGTYTLAQKNRRSAKELLKTKTQGAEGADQDINGDLSGESPDGTVAALQAVDQIQKALEQYDKTLDGSFQAEIEQPKTAARAAMSSKRKTSRRKKKRLTAEQKEKLHHELFEAAQKALSDSGFADQTDRTFPEKVSGLYVMPIKTTDAFGYLTVCFQNVNPDIQSKIIYDFQQGLTIRFDTLEIQTEKVDSFWIPIDEPRFGEIVSENTDYYKTARFHDSLIGVAFFPTQDPIPSAEARDDEQQMLDIWVKDLEVSHPVTFKAYLHLTKNQKYYLYLRNGRTLLPEQKERLDKSNIERLHIKSIDAKNFKIFVASAFFANLKKLKAS